MLGADDYEFAIDKLWPANNLGLRGAGPAFTKVQGNGRKIELHGSAADRRFSLFELSGMTLTETPLSMLHASLGVVRDVVFINSPVILNQSWDILFDNCQFIRCTDIAVHLLAGETPHLTVNNITFSNCRFENCQEVMLLMGDGARKNRFRGCKWHGALPTPAERDHIVMDGCHDNMFSACQWTNGGRNGILMTGCHDNVFAACSIGNCRRYGIEGFNGVHKSSSIVWSTTYGRNKLGDFKL